MADVVRGQIAYPEAPMPANLVQGSDADDVSVYIAKCAAQPDLRRHGCERDAAGDHDDDVLRRGGGGGSSTAAGKQVFASAGCGGCHTLKDAGSTGNVGPNLDQLKPSEARVAHQVEVGGGPMPAFKGQLSDAQIKAVAAYVSSVAGK